MLKGVVATELKDQLQKSLGSAYTLEGELGGGGMSRVFLAREEAFGRQVVVKVLPPDLAGVSADRFKREIQLAARLQHPHIVPLLSAGELDGIPYYTMPFVDGESLRKRLARDGKMPINEVIRLLRDIASALANAHAAGVVHRDIKPDNVMVSGGSATVLDFGVAKAVRDAADSGGAAHSGLTSLGIALGTPAYMAPEQAAADPNVDHRADIYAFGILAYEMITGRTPFGQRPANELLVAHLTEVPVAVDSVRTDCPLGLAQLVMACLAKRQSDRPHSAEAIMAALDSLSTPSGGTQSFRSTWMTPSGSDAKGSGTRAILTFAGAALVAAVLTRLAVFVFALPTWVFSGAVALLIAGNVLIAATAFAAKRRRAAGIISGVGDTPLLTWRRASFLTAAGLLAYSVFVSGYVVLRTLGIGPGASLMAAGKLKEKSKVIVTDFRVLGSDSTLGSVVTEAIRTDLSQSRVVSLMQPLAVMEAMQRMQKPMGTKIDIPLARDLAQREGVTVIVDGDVAPAGSGYVLSARVINAQSGDVLAAVRETAADGGQVIPAIDRLSRELRRTIGESMQTLRDQAPLDQVTTASLPALRKYAEGTRAIEVDGNYPKGIAALEESVKLDTTFAMAYRKLGVSLSNVGLDPTRATKMLERAYAFRDRLPPVERLLAEGSYWMGVKKDDAKALAVLQQALELEPANRTALINSSVLFLDQRDFVQAESVLLRLLAVDSSRSQPYTNLIVAQVAQGKVGEAKKSIATLQRRFPQNTGGQNFQAQLLGALGDYDGAQKLFASLAAKPSTDAEQRLFGTTGLGNVAATQGRLREAAKQYVVALEAQRSYGVPLSPVAEALAEITMDIWYREAGGRGAKSLDQLLAKSPLSAMKLDERPYIDFVTLYAWAGRPDRARALLAEYDTQMPSTGTMWRDNSTNRDIAFAEILLAEKKYTDAIAAFRKADRGSCRTCVLPRLATAYDLAGQRDSAIATFERYRTTPELFRLGADASFLAGVQKRLGELYEAGGDKVHALERYEQFIGLWKDADADLQPKVRAAQQRVAALRAQVKS